MDTLLLTGNHLTFEQALLFGLAKRAARGRVSRRVPLMRLLFTPKWSACSQARNHLKEFTARAIIGVGGRNWISFFINGAGSLETAKCSTFSTNCAISCDTRAHFLCGRRAKDRYDYLRNLHRFSSKASAKEFEFPLLRIP